MLIVVVLFKLFYLCGVSFNSPIFSFQLDCHCTPAVLAFSNVSSIQFQFQLKIVVDNGQMLEDGNKQKQNVDNGLVQDASNEEKPILY